MQGFYHNLEKLYEKYRYPLDNIWNCDESGVQASKTGGGRVWTQKGSRYVHTLIPNEREHITTLTCINAAGSYIPNFYIFKGKRIRDNYILHCKSGAAMAMQSAAWMTQVLSSSWMSHFIAALERHGGVSHEHQHLLIVDGHNSHVTVDVVMKAMEVGLDPVTLLFHTSHRLQPLDVAVFAPYKKAFWKYRDAWVVKHLGRSVGKKILALWVSLGL